MAAKLLVDQKIMIPRTVSDPKLRECLLWSTKVEIGHRFKELEIPYHYLLSRYIVKYWGFRNVTGEDVKGCRLDFGAGPHIVAPQAGLIQAIGRFWRNFGWH